MNPLDNLLPPEPFLLDPDEALAEAARLHAIRSIRARERARIRRINTGRRERSMSSNSGDDLPAFEPAYTPDGSTPALESEGAVKKPELVVVDEKEVGMNAGLKHLYSGKEDKRGRFQWQTKIPEDLGKPAEDADSLKWAILVRHVKVYGDPRRVLALHSIVVQSPLLKELLKEVLAGYPGVTTSLKRLEFSGNFEPLIHR